MRTKVFIALAQISLGVFLSWTFALLFGRSDSYDAQHAFSIGCIISGLVTVGVGAVSQNPSAGGYNSWHKVWDEWLLRTNNEAASPTVLTAFGVVFFVAPQLFVVGALTFPHS